MCAFLWLAARQLTCCFRPLLLDVFVLHAGAGHSRSMLLCLAPQGGKVLVWFRSDLRVHDNPALTHALEEAGTVVPVYCFDPRQFGKTSFGFEKTGMWRVVVLWSAAGSYRVSAQHWA